MAVGLPVRGRVLRFAVRWANVAGAITVVQPLFRRQLLRTVRPAARYRAFGVRFVEGRRDKAPGDWLGAGPTAELV